MDYKVRHTKGPAEVQLGDDVYKINEWREGVSYADAENLTRAGHVAEYGFESDPPIGRDQDGKAADTITGGGAGEALPPVGQA